MTGNENTSTAAAIAAHIAATADSDAALKRMDAARAAHRGDPEALSAALAEPVAALAASAAAGLDAVRAFADAQIAAVAAARAADEAGSTG